MNENWERPHNVRARPRFEKPFNNAPGNAQNFWRRPSFRFSRRNMMAGRYPNMGFRHRAPSMFQHNCPMQHVTSQGLRHSKLNSPTGILPPFVQRPPFLGMLPHTFDNKNNQNILPITNINGSLVAVESEKLKSETTELNLFSDLWVEAIAPGGRIYYYNTRTRESTWMKPINVRIIELSEIKQLTVYPEEEKTEKHIENPIQSVPQQPIANSYINNVFYPTNDSVQPRFPVFPPNVFTPPPNFIKSPVENAQNNVENCNITFMMSPSVLNVPVIAHNLLPNSITNDSNACVSQNFVPSNNIVVYNSNVAQDLLPNQNFVPSNGVVVYNSNVEQDVLPKSETDFVKDINQSLLVSNEIVDYNKNGIKNSLSSGKMSDNGLTSLPQSFTKNELVTYSSSDSDQSGAEISNNGTSATKLASKNKNISINNPQSNVSLSSSDSTEINITEDVTKIIGQKENEQSKNAVLLNEESHDSVSDEEKPISLVNHLTKAKPIDKSRPVSSTPISGTHWCVVWTGDERVFFHDSLRKLSFWERPAELLNRSDVDEMVKKSPLSLNLKPLMREIRKSSSDHLDMTKKQKKDNETGKASRSKETNTDKNLVENNLEVELKTECETPSLEQKIEASCEMLSENKISVSSMWEKDVHEIVFDSRYLLLPTKERKQVFENYLKSKSEEEKIKYEKEQQQKEAFLSLLVEAGVTSKSLLCDIAQRYSDDVRFKSVKDVERKESIFKQYVSELENNERQSERRENELKIDFLELLSEKNCFDKKWSEVQDVLADDERYKAIHSDSLKEHLFKEYNQGKCLNIWLSKTQKHADDSLKHHERGMNSNSSNYQKNQQKEEKHKYALAISNFKTLLDDLIEDSNIDWESATEILKADQRWDGSQELEPDKREEIFYVHAKTKKKEKFRRLLDELPNITIKSSWLDIRKNVLKDPRCAKFSSCERECEKEFKEYLNCKQLRVKIEFMQLLKETKWITDKTKSLLDSPNHLKDIEKALSQDKRYLNLDCMRSERKKILLGYIDKLHANGLPTNNDLSKPIQKDK